jgi:hypothetical protein
MPRLTTSQVIAALVLAALAGARYATYERAPGMSIRWREDVTDARRRQLERGFRLARGRAAEGRTMTYDLLDLRSSNVRALIAHPQVEDTGYLDRTTFNVPANAPFGQGGMWVGTRMPVLRIRGVVPALAIACVIFLASPLIRAGWRRRRSHAA